MKQELLDIESKIEVYKEELSKLLTQRNRLLGHEYDISKADLSVRAKKILNTAGYEKWGEFADLTRADLLRYRYLGKKTSFEIANILEELKIW